MWWESVSVPTASFTLRALAVGEHILVQPAPELELIEKEGNATKGMATLVKGRKPQEKAGAP